MHYFNLLIYISFLSFTFGKDVIVETTNGKIQGLITRSQKGLNIYTFYGIRYAEPPIGKNRFKPPIPVKRRSTKIQSATTKGQACIQSTDDYSLNLVEDCLFLDVYSTDLSASRPVIIFIHGGTFVTGSKADASPDYLLDKDIVLVSINYRLNVFGFFSIGTKDASGNQGFKDQNLAIKWVRQNIKSFGGNPNLITLCGQSAGGFSVSLHLLSPVSYGLFQRAIAISGAAVGFAMSATRNSSQFMLEHTNCNKANPAKSVECLQSIPAEELISISAKIPIMIAWYYSIESIDDDQPFLTEFPREIARNGRIQKMPIMTGITLDEFLISAYELIKGDPTFIDSLNANFSETLSSLLLYSSNPNRDQISATVKSFYLKNQSVSIDTLEPFAKLISDGFIGIGVNSLVEYARNQSEVYYYRFDYQGRYSQIYQDNGKPLGILHGDDLQYSFLLKYVAPVFKVDGSENFMVERMTSWFANFAKKGNPNDPSNEYINRTTWTPCNKDSTRSMYINTTLTVSSGPFRERFAVWDSLFPLY